MNQYSTSWFEAIRTQTDPELTAIVHGFDAAALGNIAPSLEQFKTLWYPQNATPQFCVPHVSTQLQNGKYPASVQTDCLDSAVDQTLFFIASYAPCDLRRAAAERELQKRGWTFT